MKNVLKSKIREIEHSNSKKILNLINSLSEQIKTDNTAKETKKLYDILNDKIPEIKDSLNKDSQKETSFEIVSEINRINLKNTAKLLDCQNSLLENYTRKIVEQTLILNERMRKNYSMKYLYLAFFSFCAYEFYTNFYHHQPNLDLKKLISNYQEKSVNLLKFDTKIPFFEDHSNVTNLLSNYSRLFLIGETGIGKSLSIKNYALMESQNPSSIVLYLDLNKLNIIKASILDILIMSQILEGVRTEDISMNNINELLNKLKEYNVLIILDNFSSISEQFLKKSLDLADRINGKLITVAKDNEFSEKALNSKIYKKNR